MKKILISKRVTALVLTVIMYMMPLTVNAAAVNTDPNLIQTFVNKVEALTEPQKEKFVDLFVLLQDVDDATGLAAAYTAAFSTLSTSQGDRIEAYGATTDAVARFAGFITDESFSETNLREYLGLDDHNVSVTNKSDFIAAITSRDTEFRTAFLDVTLTQIDTGMDEMATVFDLLSVFEIETFQIKVFDATSVNGSLSINNTKFSDAIAAANIFLAAQGYDTISSATSVKPAFQKLVDYYNSSSDKTLIYTYLNGYGLINVVASSTGGTTPTPTPTPTPVSVPTSTVQDEVDAASTTVVTATVNTTTGVQEANIQTATLTTALVKAKEAVVAATTGTQTTNQEIKTKVILEIPAVAGAAKVSATLPVQELLSMQEEGLDAIAVKTSAGEVEFTMDSFLAEDEEATDIKFEMELVDAAELEGVPEEALVVEFNLYIDGSEVTEFKKPIALSIPYVPAAGEDANNITVYFLQEDGTSVAVGGVYNAATGMVEFLTNHFSKYYAKQAQKVTFSDVPSTYWAATYIQTLAGKGIITGSTNNMFKPIDNITRAEFVAMVVRSLKLVDTSAITTFTDVDTNAWYAKDIRAAVAAGIIKGRSVTSFAPTANITREEAAVIISNVLKYKGFKLETGTSLINTKFTDTRLISSWAKNAVATAYREEVINGKANNVFDPKGSATRAEVAKMIYQVYFIN